MTKKWSRAVLRGLESSNALRLPDHVRQVRVGKYHSGKNAQGKPLGFKTFISPSQEAQRRHTWKLKQVIRQNRGAPQKGLIGHLNPIIQGWTHYYRTAVASRCFNRMAWAMGGMLIRWAKWRHPKKRAEWRKARSWKRVEDLAGDSVVSHEEFSTEGARLYVHTRTTIQRHLKVAGLASPYDGNLVYWARRNYMHPLTKTREGILLRQQKGRCASCGLYLKDGDVRELDHIIPKRLGGTDELNNLQVLHRHCHDRKTTQDGSSGARAGQVPDDRGLIDEEPCARKRARTVLKGGG